jgi:very-short-patch-repair endonuclease
MNYLAKQAARKLRKNSTFTEEILWQAVRRKNLDGKKFYRQYVIKVEVDNQERFFIADFYNHESKLVIELDGKIHDIQKDYDNLRTEIISLLGIKVIRFNNDEIENDLEKVLNKIREELSSNLLLSLERLKE